MNRIIHDYEDFIVVAQFEVCDNFFVSLFNENVLENSIFYLHLKLFSSLNVLIISVII